MVVGLSVDSFSGRTDIAMFRQDGQRSELGRVVFAGKNIGRKSLSRIDGRMAVVVVMVGAQTVQLHLNERITN